MSGLTDEEMYKILTDFGNGHTLARDIEVTIRSGYTSLHAKCQEKGFKYEDGQLLSEIIRGAESFMFWLRREGKARLVRLDAEYTRKGAKPSNSVGLASKERRK